MVYVVKATGEKEAFDEIKLRNSIKRAGVADNLQDEVVSHIKKNLYNNITTKKIYEHILEFLKKTNDPFIASKYGLKQAIMSLGPTGYPFEDLVGGILKTKGYETELRQILIGKCITHEIDIVAQKSGTDKKIMIEAKFHNMPGSKTDVHVALYTKSRFDDIKEKNGLIQAWIVTNTKATTDAISYAACENIKIISWNYPEGESLRELIEESRLVPISALTTLTLAQKQHFLSKHIVLCKDINDNPDLLYYLNLPNIKKQNILSEIKYLSNINT